MHRLENPGRILVVLKGIEGDDHVGARISAGPPFGDHASIRHSRGRDTCGGAGIPPGPGLEANDTPRAAFRELDHLVTFATTEIDDDLVAHLGPNLPAQELFELAGVLVGGWHAIRHRGQLARRVDRT